VALTSFLAWPPGSPRPALAAKPHAQATPVKKRGERESMLARARVWEANDISSLDLLTGPTDHKPFRFDETVTCTFLDKPLSGRTPKFACRVDPDDELKVKIGGANGEVYAEVASTRLLWALGFGADRMYSVRVVCRDCPEERVVSGVQTRGKHETVFDPAAVERKLSGAEVLPPGWSWEELDRIDERAGGASRAERDALKLLAVFIQHTDSKPEQQRMICRDHGKRDGDDKAPVTCEHPFMYLNDLGVTFGRANRWNTNATGSMNLVEWSQTPVWKDPERCIGYLPKSQTGTLDNPAISEEGRQFLADLLVRLSDEQLRQLFQAARVGLRLRNPEDVFSGFATVDEWVAAFKAKRDQIVNLRCAAS
jgi:hypothetical protein